MISFSASKLVSLLVYPLSMSLLLCVLALFFARLRWDRFSSYTLMLGIGWLYLCSTALFANFLSGTLERGFEPRAMSVVERADAIVLLGGATRGDTRMGKLADLNQHADRLVHAVELYKAGKAPVILLSGGGVGDGRPEALQMKDFLGIMGVPVEHVLLEKQSRNTYDNAVYSARMLKDNDMHRILLVTSAFHMRRALGVFERQGLEVVPAPADYQQLASRQVIPEWLPTVSSLHQSTDALHEIVGYGVYRLKGWL